MHIYCVNIDTEVKKIKVNFTKEQIWVVTKIKG